MIKIVQFLPLTANFFQPNWDLVYAEWSWIIKRDSYHKDCELSLIKDCKAQIKRPTSLATH